ncbi:response regulator [Neobacillus citreus]|uniref:Response regulator n=1 Tax=Neobacillus citreus TaxID=2833578 RepID=A0A942YA84_9BACI|nr:response regulator [Neobacillus citreus]MCH6266593.1 response regulator [Neobacillus citreus]
MIMVVDDSQFMRNLIKEILNEANIRNIIEAENGEEAVKKYKLYSPDVVVMDITMPLLNGLDALEEIIKIAPKAKVIMCSSVGQQSTIQDALKIGASDFVVKPYFHNLSKIVHSLLS